MKSLTLTEARKNIYRLVDETADTHIPIHLTGKKNNAVLVSEKDWNAINETLHLLSIPGMRASIVEGLNTPLSETVDSLDW